ncbi:inactive tyrosine-protein kinase PRAG1 [Cinclus cinclus]|uniref:inactive tyrosine-protein kinase PRAG1 n=1 Tax=Cinclus cinclus TaxID=127875 RepID=UPI002E1674FA
MSVCNDFVENIWKPGSCKNCFNLKSSHRLQTPPDVGACGVIPDGARTKPESLVLEEGGLNTSHFSKPTIAVKPTMINSDVSDMWADVNMNAELSQVSWGVISGKQLLLKSGDAQCICLDNFASGDVRKPFLHNQPNDCLSCCPPSYSMVGLHGLESQVERNVSIHSLVLVDEVDKQEDRVKDKFALPHQVPCPNLSTLRDRSTTNSSRNTTSQAREGAVLPSGCDCGHISSIFESEGGEYCSITNCLKEHPIPRWRLRDAPETPRPRGRAVKFSEEEHKAVNVAFCITKDQRDPLPYALCSERKNLSLHTKPATLPESTGSCKAAAFALSQEDEDLQDLPLPGEPFVTGGLCTEGSSTPQEALVEPQCPRLTEPAHGDPIYAESTKRRKAQLKAVGSQAEAEKLVHGTAKEKADWLWRDSGWVLGGEKEHQDSTGQVAAKITIMTAHTEDDHKTIFLSSPDSAVGVQWPCISPTSHSDFGTSSPAIESGQIFQASGHENSTRFHLAAPVKTSLTESPAIPPKMSRNRQPGSEGRCMPPVSSHVGRFGDDNSHDGAGAQLLPRSCTDTGAFGMTPSPCTHVNGVSVESSRGVAGSSYDRRQKYCNPLWTKQCQIEEEEQEEEEGVLNHLWTVGAESGRAGSEFVDGGLILESQTGMTKSSFSFGFPKDKSNGVEFAPPPPPKKQSRYTSMSLLKMNPSNTELERVSNSSAESLSPPFRSAHISFTAGSSDSLDSDTQTGSDSRHSSEPNHSPSPAESQVFPPVPFLPVSTVDGPSSAPSCPPPLPQKKTVIRTVSSPDGFFGGQASSGKAAGAASPRLNVSHSESNVCLQEEPTFIHQASLGDRPGTFSSSESLEKSSKGNGYWGSSTGKSTGACGPSRNLQSLSSSQLSVSSQVSSASSLHNLLSNIDSKEGVYSKLGALYTESLRRLVAKCEDCFMREQKNELHFSENNWSLFKLTCNKPCCNSGDAIYYCATCSKDPSTTYAVKICKTQESKVAASYCSPAVPVHFNIQQDCGHFVASVPSSMLLASDVGKSMPRAGLHPSRTASEHNCVVVITREVPSQTTADFVRDSVMLHQAKPELYERRVCFLLLQLCNGLEHLKEHGIIHRDLCLENLLLVPCKPPMSCVKAKDDKHLPRLIISNFLKAKQKTGTGDSKLKKSQARLAPEIVSASQYKKFDEFQTGILIYELLHQPNPFEEKVHLREQEYSPEDLPALPNLSIYSQGLQQLAHLLLEADPIKRVRITEAKRMLQCLLWGPRKDLVEQPLSHEETLCQVLQNWMNMKRALLMMKFAERAVDTERSIELEDWLCCQYLASAEPASLLHTLKLLQLL